MAESWCHTSLKPTAAHSDASGLCDVSNSQQEVAKENV